MATGVTPKKVRKLADAAIAGPSEDDGQDDISDTLSTLKEIDKYQGEIETLCNQANKEMIEIERKYSQLKSVHFAKRNELISKIPRFWITAFVNHPDLNALLDETEEDCFHYLLKIELEEAADITSGYRINFYFDENPYFENTVLSKEFHLGVPDFPTSQSTPIKWKDGFDLTQNAECSGSSKDEEKQYLEQRSFFAWYNDHVDPLSDDIAEVIKDDLWINPLNYYLIPNVDVENSGEEKEHSDGEEDEEGEEVIEAQTEEPDAQHEEDDDDDDDDEV